MSGEDVVGEAGGCGAVGGELGGEVGAHCGNGGDKRWIGDKMRGR